MLKDRNILAVSGASNSGSNQDYSAATWDTVKKLNATLSNGNLTATANMVENYTRNVANLVVTGDIYVEITFKGFTGGSSSIGLTDFALALENSAAFPSNSVRTTVASGDTGTNIFSISYNPTTGEYAIRKNNVLVSSGTVPDKTKDMRPYTQGGSYVGVTVATINTGITAFTYTPVYL